MKSIVFGSSQNENLSVDWDFCRVIW